MKTKMIKLMAAAALLFAGAGAQAGVIASDSRYGLFDDFGGNRYFDITEHGQVNNLSITISFAKCDNPVLGPAGGACQGTGSPFENEIELRLIGPDGTVVNLVKQNTFENGARGVGQVEVSFEDSGAALGTRVAAGSFRPVDALGIFNGLDMFGRWTLYLGDTAGSDPLEYYYSQLAINMPLQQPPSAVPEPASLGLLALGLGGLALRRRRSAKA